MLDVRTTSHMSAGMLAYVRALDLRLPEVAPDLRIERFGYRLGDNFDVREQLGIPLLVARRRPRLVHFPTPFVPRLVPAPYAVTVHDVIDLEFPQYAKRKVGPYWRHVVGPVLRGARAVITDDDATVALLERFLRVDRARVRVIPLGVDTPNSPTAPERRSRPYLLYAGNHRPHKDLGTLVSAWASLPNGVEADLVMTGDEDPALRALAAGARGELVFTGECGSERLDELFRGALAYVQPSLREGFGLPLLEALQAGTPVIAAETAVPSVLKAFVHRYPPRDAAALRALLLRACAEAASPGSPDSPPPMRAEAQRAREATAHLTWERTVRATADVYRELLQR